jgi:2-hydroxy-6-oxonona-2,4-dienedioate hydrolase
MTLTDQTEISESATSRTAFVAGMTVHYHDLGEGPPLLMLPSFGPRPGTTAWLTFGKVVGALSQHYRCIMMDLPNYGRSGPVVFHEPLHDFFGRVALELMASLGYDRFTALGNSQGGQVAGDMAVMYPEHIERVVFGAGHISTGGDKYLHGSWPAEAGRLGREAEADVPDRDKLRRFMRALVYDESLITEELVDSFYEMRNTSPAYLEAIAASVLVPKNNLGEIARISVPALIIHGRFDREVPFEQGLALLSYVRSADLVVLNNCGHWPPFERPEDYSSIVLDFLKRTATS